MACLTLPLVDGGRERLYPHSTTSVLPTYVGRKGGISGT